MDAGGLVLEAIENGPQPTLVESRAIGEKRHGTIGHVSKRLVTREVQLRPVAGRETHSLAVLAGQLLRQRGRLLAAQRDALAQLDGGDAMRHADEEQAHAKWVSGRPRRAT